MFTRASILILALPTLFISPAVFADGTDGPATRFGIKAGLFSPGTVSTDERTDDAFISYGAGAFVDRALGESLYGGISLDVGNLDVFDESATLVDLSLNLKGRLSAGDRWRILPGIGLGYGVASESDFFIVKASVELLIPSDRGPSWLLEAAVLGAPAGGNSETNVTFGPGFMLRGGLTF